MRIAIAALLSLVLFHCGPSCTISEETYTVPTYLDPGALNPAEGPTGSATATDADYTLYVSEWKAMSCEAVCEKIVGQRTACEPMTQTPGGKYEVKCTVRSCSQPVRFDGNWT